ncbi:MAG: methyltransferase family protein [Candidatus Methylomirabilales bacterium]
MSAHARILSRRWTWLIGPLLPLTVLVLLPLLITRWDRHLVVFSLGPFRWLGLLPICLGVSLGIWSAFLLLTRGEGTPAPWDPPEKFVLAGPYQYLRNPMMLGGFLTLSGEAIVAQSLAILLYFLLVMSFACWYVIAVEEKELKARFGDTYLAYKECIPRWVPRLTRKR